MFSWADIQAYDKKHLESVAENLTKAHLTLLSIQDFITKQKNNVPFTKVQLDAMVAQLDLAIAALNLPGNYKDKQKYVQKFQDLRNAIDALPDATPVSTLKIQQLTAINLLIKKLDERIKKDEDKIKKAKFEFSLSSFSDNPLFYTGRYAASTVFNENVSYYVGPVLSTLFIAGIAQAWLASPFLGAPMPIQAASGAFNGASGLLGYFTGLGGQFVELVSGNPIVAKLLQVPYAGPALQSGASFVTGTLGSVAGLATHGLSAMATATNLVWYVGVPYACLRVVSAFFEVLEQAKKLIAPAFKGVTDSISIISSGISGIFSAFKMGASFISSAFSGLKSLWDMTRTPRNYASVILEELGPSSSTVKAAAALPGAAAANVWAYTGQPVLNAGKGAMVNAYKAYQNGFKAAVAPLPSSPISAQKLRA